MQSRDEGLMSGTDNILEQKMFASFAEFNAAATNVVDNRRKVDSLLECCTEVYPWGKRLAPVGANDDDDDDEILQLNVASFDPIESSCQSQEDSKELQRRILEMEQDQEELSNSLMALTSHFAKVQLRLQQVIGAPPETQEDLLKELENFTNRGIPDISSPRVPPETHLECQVDELPSQEAAGSNQVLEAQRKKHAELIHQLKGKLEDLESYAYESGEGDLPSNLLLERQRVVMEQLRTRLNLKLENIDKLTAEELRALVDAAVGQLVNPLKMKNQLVNQLQTQIHDLETFIGFLLSDSPSTVPLLEDLDCGCGQHNVDGHKKASARCLTKSKSKSEQEKINLQTVSLLRQAVTALQLTAMGPFGCGTKPLTKSVLKSKPKLEVCEDLQVQLDRSVDHLIEACNELDQSNGTDRHAKTKLVVSSTKAASIVRKELAVALRDLIQHGLLSPSTRMSFMSCMSARTSSQSKAPLTHAWSVILKFYDMKQGRKCNAAPSQKLAQSFGLDPEPSGSTPKVSLMSTIEQILSSHIPYKRSMDAQLKAFVCAAMNQRKLTTWLRSILRNQTILESCYEPWSYVAKTGFEEALKSLDRLSSYSFNLPVNLAVKQFQDSKESF